MLTEKEYVDEIISIAKDMNYDFTYNDKLRFDGNQPQISIGTPTKIPGKINKDSFGFIMGKVK